MFALGLAALMTLSRPPTARDNVSIKGSVANSLFVIRGGVWAVLTFPSLALVRPSHLDNNTV